MDATELAALLDGDRAALQRFVRDYGPVIQQAVQRRLQGRMREELEDVMSEILVKLLGRCPETGTLARDLRKYNPSICPLRSFVFYYADKRTLDWMRRWQRLHEHEVNLGDAAVIERAGAVQHPALLPEEQPEWLPEVFRRFQSDCSAEDQHLYQLYFIAGRSGQEVATELGILPNAAYTRAKRLKARLLKIRDEVRTEAELRKEEPVKKRSAVSV